MPLTFYSKLHETTNLELSWIENKNPIPPVFNLNWLIAEEYFLEDNVCDYRYLTQGDLQIDLDDCALYKQLLAAFRVIKMSEEEVKGECF